MILLLLSLFETLGFKIPNLFFYASTRMLFASIVSLGLTVVLGKVFIKKLYELKVGHTVRVTDVAVLKEQYQKSEHVPSMGGIIFISTIFISTVLLSDFSQIFTYVLLLTMLVMGGIGFLDDFAKLKKKKSLGISGRRKFWFQVVFYLIFSSYLFCPFVSSKFSGANLPHAKVKMESGEFKKIEVSEYSKYYYIPFFKKPYVVSGVFVALAVLLTIVVVTGSTNAVNLTDGLDGLAAGLALLVATVLAVVAFLMNNAALSDYLNILHIEGSGEIAVFLSALIGSLIGFLWFNGYPAQVFMGDTGSLALGGILGVSAVLLRREFLYALVGGIFVLETLSVILQVLSFRFRNGKRIFLCAPIHHHFQMKGWHEMKVVLRFWMWGLLLALIGLASIKIQ